MDHFKLVSEYSPTGDQPQAIEQLVQGFKEGNQCQTLLGVFREVTEVGEALEKLQEVTGSVTCAKAAVLYDRENDWALKDAQGPRNEDMHCLQ